MLFTNWDELTEVIVGSSYEHGDLDSFLDDNIKEKFNTIIQETKEDLDNLAINLENFGIKVYRPTVKKFKEKLSFPDFNIPFPTAPIVPRDQYFVYGNTIIQTYTSMPDRYFDSLNYQNIFVNLFDKGYDWISQPPPVIKTLNGNERWWLSGDKVYRELEKQILWHTATMFKCGDSIIVNGRGPGTKRGLEWVKKIYPKTTFVENNEGCMKNFGHIDHGWFMINDDLIFCINKSWVPKVLHQKEIIEIGFLLDNWDLSNFMKEFYKTKGRLDKNWIDRWLSQWKGYMQETHFDTNVLILDPCNVMFNIEQPKLFRFLETFGINCHVSKQRHGLFWEAGVHCLTLDISRKGSCRKII